MSVRIKQLGKWKFSTTLQILHAVRYPGGMHKNAFFRGCNIFCCHGNNELLLLVEGRINKQKFALNVNLSISRPFKRYNLILTAHLVILFIFTVVHSIFHERLFSIVEFLTPQQIKSYFSRFAAKRRQPSKSEIDAVQFENAVREVTEDVIIAPQ